MSFEQQRAQMVEQQLRARGIADDRVLLAMLTVPRHLFVEPPLEDRAYEDCPLPTLSGQTISQPYIVARMTELVAAGPVDRVLEVGTGGGYHSAVLAELGAEVFTIERIERLAQAAKVRLDALGYTERVHVRSGDGCEGWPEAAPFNGIVVTAAVREVPRPLVSQLAMNGRLVLPLGESDVQGLATVRKTSSGLEVDYSGECRFVKLIGEYGWEE